jgi:hypothetical protein
MKKTLAWLLLALAALAALHFAALHVDVLAVLRRLHGSP